MSFIRHGGITYVSGGSRPAIVLFRSADGSVAPPSAQPNFTEPPDDKSCNRDPWARWGEKNDLPNKTYAKYVGNIGVLSSGTDIISRIAIGRGPMPCRVKSVDDEGNEAIEMINDPEIMQWLRRNNAKTYSYETILDALQTGVTFTQCLANRDLTAINRIVRTDPTTGRYQLRNTKGKIENVYISHEWGNKAMSEGSPYLAKLPLLDINNPLEDLTDGNGNLQKLPREFVVSSRYRLLGRQYYPAPLWWSVRDWCEIVMGVPEMKAHMLNNQMTIKYVIDIHQDYWSTRFDAWGRMSPEEREETREKVLKEMDAFLGSNENAYKSLIVLSRPAQADGKSEPLVKITPVPDLMKEGKLLPDSAAGNSEILFSLALNPALLGVDMPGNAVSGGKGGSNIREAFLVQILIREVEREFVCKPLNLVADVNGWTDKWPGLEFRFPNHYLTTLDSGKNAKPTV